MTSSAVSAAEEAAASSHTMERTGTEAVEEVTINSVPRLFHLMCLFEAETPLEISSDYLNFLSLFLQVDVIAKVVTTVGAEIAGETETGTEIAAEEMTAAGTSNTVKCSTV